MKYEIVEKVFERENPKSIFEVGCANGSLLKDYYDTRKVIVGGLDINPVQNAKETFPEYANNFIQFNATQDNWPIPDNSYDIVFTIGTLILIENPLPIIKEMLRIAKDKIILAESHSEIEKIENTGGDRQYYRYRYIRDYKKLLPNAIITPGDSSKHIIKCQKKTINLQ